MQFLLTLIYHPKNYDKTEKIKLNQFAMLHIFKKIIIT